MKQILLLYGLMAIDVSVNCQSNYVANTGNSATPGLYNTMVGAGAGNAILTGTRNAFIGYYTGHDNTNGERNAFLGTNAGQSNTSGSYNAFVGFAAGNSNTTGSNNTFLGANAGESNTSGSSNSFVGCFSGELNTTGKIIATSASTQGKIIQPGATMFLWDGEQVGKAKQVAITLLLVLHQVQTIPMELVTLLSAKVQAGKMFGETITLILESMLGIKINQPAEM